MDDEHLGSAELEATRATARHGRSVLTTILAVGALAACDSPPDVVIVPPFGDDESFDESGAWVTGGALPEAVWSPAAAVWDGQIYVIGGYDADGVATSSVVRVDPATLQVERLGDFPRAFADGAAVSYRDTLLVVGGNGGDELNIAVSPKVLWYDADNDAWEDWGDLPEQRFRHTAQAVGDAVVVVGGHAFNTPPNDSIAIVVGRTASYGPPPNRDFSYPLVSATLGDTLLVMASFFNSRVLRFVGSAGTWIEPLGNPASGPATGGVLDGRIHVFAVGATPAHRIWDAGASAWITAPPPMIPVTRAASVGVGGRYFLIGGENSSGVAVSSIQAYTPPS